MENDNEIQHMVIGHSQIRHLEDYDFPDKPEINFHIDFKCVGGGLAPNLIRIIKEQLTQAKKPMRISAIIWQNSNWDISVQQVEEIVWDMEHFLRVYPYHRVAFPECQYVPQQERIWDKIARINTVLNSYNLRQGFAKYPLHKVTMQYSKQKKSLVVRQTSYREYNNAIRAASEQPTNDAGDIHSQLGYHIDEGAPKRRYAQHIRRFHLNGFNDSIPRPRVLSPEPERSSTISFARNPVNKMKSPKEIDARMVINKIRSDKMNLEQENRSIVASSQAIDSNLADSSSISKNDQAASLPQLAESSSSKQPEQEMTKAGMNDWLEKGQNTGYLSIITKLIKEKEKQKRGKKRKRSESSDSSDSDSEKRRRKVKKRKNKKKSKPVSSSSSSESSSSSSSSESSEDEKLTKRSKKKRQRKEKKKGKRS